MELAYSSLRENRLGISMLGLTALAVSTLFFLLPIAEMAVSFGVGSVIRSGVWGLGFLDLVRAVLSVQNALFFALPVAGLTVGIAGITASGKRCVLSASAVAFNGLMLMLLLAAGM